MAISVKKAAAGNAPATGMPKTPAPTRQAPPDAVDQVRNPTAQSYGENGPRNNASRTNPGEMVESDLARNLRQSSDDGEDVLGKIIKGGAHSVDMGNSPDVNWQQRTVPDTALPTTFGMRNRSGETAKIPAKCGASAFNPTSIRKPG